MSRGRRWALWALLFVGLGLSGWLITWLQRGG